MRILFNAHHSPIGAFASFTLGMPGASGGLGLELDKPANQEVFIGLESEKPGTYDVLPFVTASDIAAAAERARYEQEESNQGLPPRVTAPVQEFDSSLISRDFKVATDSWSAGDLTFTVYSPVTSVPDPELGDTVALKAAIVPAVLAELTIDNSNSARTRRGFFGYRGSDPYSGMRKIDSTLPGYVGVAQGLSTAIVSDTPGARTGQAFSLGEMLAESRPDNYAFGLGGVGAVVVDVPAGEIKTVRFAICFYRDGTATSGFPTRYYYTRFFQNIEAVAEYALSGFDSLKAAAISANSIVDDAGLSGDQQFMLAHAIRSYYGSSELLERDGKPLWVVNEGEYRMMNTFDLTVDQLFFELKMNPWSVRNELDLFLAQYSYVDQVHGEGSETLYPGGISFTHDMGVSNVFSRKGYSSYEMHGLEGCFSYMTYEQLVNWIICALLYSKQTGDEQWLTAHLPTLEACLESMVNRDHHDPSKRDGIMSFDSSRTSGGSEITTYDSLDVSLGQARRNIYLASKSWASYVMLDHVFTKHNRPDLAQTARRQAELCATTLVNSVSAEGYIPAVLEHGNDSKIIPAIEGLVYPYIYGCRSEVSEKGPYGELISALKRHFATVLKPGVCLFPDGGWKLSSTSSNSWLSKIYLSQFVARQVLRMNSPSVTETPDRAHVAWLVDPQNAYWAWSDQIISGKAMASRYYPRGVTSILWTFED